ncbi:hypothetical protein SD427_13650 [Chryseobacterium sp. JJR-5R]|uniref:hypothetical protein n=1 Tax=Chryseobacterium sp. JJR-5R TaxID=3093923 RepID=UPI002A757500|nr:hypothetical protein [Chryseobacterium sp. JJR-5R]WPO81809.1 hypothetical protein SD427_13650 [Chryseobacterium sp. JJR-5R]
MKNKLYALILLLLTICCSNIKHENDYSINIHYQYVIFKDNNLKSYNIYIENFLNIRNNTKDTLIIPHKDIEKHLKMIYKSDSISLNFMSNNDIKIVPSDSIDLNCATNLNQTVKEIPLKVNKENYKIYNEATKSNLSYSDDYEIIRSTKFGVFKEKYLK